MVSTLDARRSTSSPSCRYARAPSYFRRVLLVLSHQRTPIGEVVACIFHCGLSRHHPHPQQQLLCQLPARRERPGARGKSRRRVPHAVAPLHYSTLLLVTSSPLGVLFSGVLQALAGDSVARGTTGSNTPITTGSRRSGIPFQVRRHNPPPCRAANQASNTAVDAWYNALDWKLIRSTRARDRLRTASGNVPGGSRRGGKARRPVEAVKTTRSPPVGPSPLLPHPTPTPAPGCCTYPLWPPS